MFVQLDGEQSRKVRNRGNYSPSAFTPSQNVSARQGHEQQLYPTTNSTPNHHASYNLNSGVSPYTHAFYRRTKCPSTEPTRTESKVLHAGGRAPLPKTSLFPSTPTPKLQSPASATTTDQPRSSNREFPSRPTFYFGNAMLSAAAHHASKTMIQQQPISNSFVHSGVEQHQQGARAQKESQSSNAKKNWATAAWLQEKQQLSMETTRNQNVQQRKILDQNNVMVMSRMVDEILTTDEDDGDVDLLNELRDPHHSASTSEWPQHHACVTASPRDPIIPPPSPDTVRPTATIFYPSSSSAAAAAVARISPSKSGKVAPTHSTTPSGTSFRFEASFSTTTPTSTVGSSSSSSFFSCATEMPSIGTAFGSLAATTTTTTTTTESQQQRVKQHQQQQLLQSQRGESTNTTTKTSHNGTEEFYKERKKRKNKRAREKRKLNRQKGRLEARIVDEILGTDDDDDDDVLLEETGPGGTYEVQRQACAIAPTRSSNMASPRNPSPTFSMFYQSPSEVAAAEADSSGISTTPKSMTTTNSSCGSSFPLDATFFETATPSNHGGPSPFFLATPGLSSLGTGVSSQIATTARAQSSSETATPSNGRPSSFFLATPGLSSMGTLIGSQVATTSLAECSSLCSVGYAGATTNPSTPNHIASYLAQEWI